MGNQTNGLKPGPSPEALSRQAAALRARAEAVVQELSARGQHLLDRKAEIEQTLGAVAEVAQVALPIAAVGVLAWKVYKARQRHRLARQARRKWAGWGQLLAAPAAHARTPFSGLLGAVLAVAASTAGKALVARLAGPRTAR